MSRGAHARCLTLSDIHWTQDAAHSDRLKSGALSNYGFVGERVADYVANLSIDDVLELHKAYSDRIKGNMKAKDEFSDRIAAKLAPILMAAQYFNEVLSDELLDIDIIEKQLIDITDERASSRDQAEEAYQQLIDFIIINKSF